MIVAKHQSSSALRDRVDICSATGVFQIEMKPPFNHKAGYLFVAPIGSDTWRTPTFLKHPLLSNMRLGPGDAEEGDRRSKAILCEDDRQLGPAHSRIEDIIKIGEGRYFHWQPAGILFSTSDGTDPNSNGRKYRAIDF